MPDEYPTPEGFILPKSLLLPDVRDFAELFEYLGEWDHATMTGKNGIRSHLAPPSVQIGRLEISPFLSIYGGRSMAVKPTPATVAAFTDPSNPNAAILGDGRLSWELFFHKNNGRTLVATSHNTLTRTPYLAYIDPATIPAADTGQACDECGNVAPRVGPMLSNAHKSTCSLHPNSVG